jgi:hypothetical protein
MFVTDLNIAVEAVGDENPALVWGSHGTDAESRRNAVPIAQIKRAADGSVFFESLTSKMKRDDNGKPKEDPCVQHSEGDEDFSNGPLLCSTAAYVWGSYGYDAKVKRDPQPVGILKRAEDDSLSFRALDSDGKPKEDPCVLHSEGDEDFSNGPLLCSTAAYVWGSYGYDDAGPNDAVPVAQVKRDKESFAVRATNINAKRDEDGKPKEDPCVQHSDGDEDFSNGPLLCSTAAYVWGSYGYDA